MSEKEIDEILISVFQKVTNEFSDFVMEQIPDTRSLAQTVAMLPKSLLTYEIVADDYFKFVNEGVNALQGNYQTKRPTFSGSRFQFRQPSVSRNFAVALQEKYRFSEPQSFAVGMSIKIHGIQAKNLTDKFFTADKLEAIATELLEKLKLPLQLTFTK